METDYTFDQFTHARVIIGIVTGFSMARILTGLARMIQRPARDSGRWLQLGWAMFLLLWVTHFWWFEFGISPAGRWTFGLYLFTIAYVALFFFTCVILFPDPQDDPDGFAQYFPAHQTWFYGLLVLLFAADAAFAALKGSAHLQLLGSAFVAKQLLLVLLALAALFLRDPRFHIGFAAVAIVLQVWWILRGFGLAP